MVAMYIIFLGILPSILLVLFLLYYSRHNVLLWWKKPRKTYVPKIFSGNGDVKHNFSFNIPITGAISFKKLLNFNRSKPEVDTPKQVEENIYENISEHDYESLKSNTELNKKHEPLYNRMLNLLHSKHDLKKGTVKKFHRKINKEDIKVADTAELENVKAQTKLDSNNSVHRVEVNKTKANLVIVNTGLASTTNESIKVDVKSHKNVHKVDSSIDEVKSNKVATKPSISLKPKAKVNKLNNNSQTKVTNVNKNNNQAFINTAVKKSNINKYVIDKTSSSSKSNDNNIGNTTRDEEAPKVNVRDLRNKFGQPHIDVKNLPKQSDLRKVGNIKI